MPSSRYIQNLHFSGEDIDYLRSLNIFEEGFLESLRDFRFEGDIDIVPEGTPGLPGGLVRVEGPLSQAQLIETTMLNLIRASDPDRHQGQPGSPGRPGGQGDGVWPAPRPGAGRGGAGPRAAVIRLAATPPAM